MYGLPPGRLTYDLYIALTLNFGRAAARQAKSYAVGARVAAGRVAPPEYYELDASDDESARRAYEEAMCRTALTR